MSTAAITAPAALTILSQLLLSISPLLRSWGGRSVRPVANHGRLEVAALLGPKDPTSGGTRRDRLGPTGIGWRAAPRTTSATLGPCPGGTPAATGIAA